MSAGTRRPDRVHPLASATARTHGLCPAHARPHHHEDRLHRSVPVPAASDTAHRDLADRVDRRVRTLLAELLDGAPA
ncbi:hypothetical protein FHX81_7649 [Saccharothrix saharensis]|uniref:Uncharacterized protein n=1 Tax=Saccharothrix saharensis TaxID=571190 RepID=A0A543JQQ6_9PSEU|nr:hypothetical protein [Saccharothrix saharensis]TQM85176.1 hypothetical protein FHX81_7649 [Saccharothrix saharensis]